MAEDVQQWVATDRVLPSLYARWMSELLGAELPLESEATCTDCAMCSTGPTAPGTITFDRSTKCCTYAPWLPNFAIGGILAAPAGQALAREVIAARILEDDGVTPSGIAPPANYQAVWDKRSKDTFGRNEALRCPYYIQEGGLCGVWDYRHAICSTWFCKHVRGQTAVEFWRALADLLVLTERSLSCWALLQLGLDSTSLSAVFPHPQAPRPLPGAAWGPWRDKREELYRHTAEAVEALSWDDVCKISGPELSARAIILVAAMERMRSHELPKRVRGGSLRLQLVDEKTARVTSYNGYDPVDLPTQLVALLPIFEGRTVDAALEALRNDGVEIDEAFVRRLVDLTILVPE